MDHTEFTHIRRMRDRRWPHEIAVILPGEFFVSQHQMMIYTILGSCISVCIRDPVSQVGGMNHFMLPEPTKSGAPADTWGETGRYGSYAMELLINGILKRGGLKDRLETKVFGGGNIYQGGHDVGAHNAAWVQRYLENEKFPLVAIDVGGPWPRKVYYDTGSGRVLMKKLDRVKNRTIVAREATYARTVRQAEQTNGITLF